MLQAAPGLTPEHTVVIVGAILSNLESFTYIGRELLWPQLAVKQTRDSRCCSRQAVDASVWIGCVVQMGDVQLPKMLFYSVPASCAQKIRYQLK